MTDPLRRFRLATAKRLRENETAAESLLWKAMRRIPTIGTHFRRQAPIGPYVADFAALRARLIVEVDGPSHAEPEQIERDARRTRFLTAEGYRVIRFWNADIREDMDSVLDTIYVALYGSLEAGPRPPSPEGGGSTREARRGGVTGARKREQEP